MLHLVAFVQVRKIIPNARGENLLMFCAAIFDDVLNKNILRIICALNVNQSTNHY